MGWLKALPDEAIRRSPVLSVFSAYAHMASGQLDGVEPRLVDAERELARIPTGSERPWADTDELRTLPATIAVYRASLAQARGDIPATKEQARRALDKAGPTDHQDMAERWFSSRSAIVPVSREADLEEVHRLLLAGALWRRLRTRVHLW